MDKLTFFGGPIIKNVQVVPIFWGSSWQDPALNASALKLVRDTGQLLAGPYMRALTQYSDIESGTVLAPVFSQATEPPNPITNGSIVAFIQSLSGNALIPDFRTNDQLLYLVVTNGVEVQSKDEGGFHSVYYGDDKALHYAWAAAAAMDVVSHEIVEACTDPEPVNGWWYAPDQQEIADICVPGDYRTAASDGVVASSYWSNKDSKCVCPARTATIIVEQDECRIGPAVGNSSILRFEFGVIPSWIDGTNLPPLVNPKYLWTIDTDVVKAIGSINQPTLEVAWLSSPAAGTNITLLVFDQDGREIYGSTVIFVQDEPASKILLKMCAIRKVFDDVRRIPFLIPKLGPDPGPYPTIREIETIRSAIAGISRELGDLENLLASPK